MEILIASTDKKSSFSFDVGKKKFYAPESMEGVMVEELLYKTFVTEEKLEEESLTFIIFKEGTVHLQYFNDDELKDGFELMGLDINYEKLNLMMMSDESKKFEVYIDEENQKVHVLDYGAGLFGLKETLSDNDDEEQKEYRDFLKKENSYIIDVASHVENIQKIYSKKVKSLSLAKKILIPILILSAIGATYYFTLSYANKEVRSLNNKLKVESDKLASLKTQNNSKYKREYKKRERKKIDSEKTRKAKDISKKINILKQKIQVATY